MLPRMLAAAAAVGLFAGVSCSAMASDLTYFTTVSNTDVADFGIGYLRNNGTGTLNVSGLSGTISSAYLYWAGPTNTTDPTANASVNFDGSAITGTNIGFSQDNFWGFLNSQAYRADVTSLVTATGNGAYALSNFNKPNAEINGASLIVFYNDGNASNNQDVVLFNGNDANFPNPYDAPGWNASLSGVNYTGGPASLTLHVSDGQFFNPGDDGNVAFNGTTIDVGGNDFDGNSVQTGNGTFPSNGALWDIRNYDVTSLLTNGANTLSEVPVQDALGLIVAQFNVPVGAAPPPPNVPEPATWAMMIAGMGVVGASLRRRQQVSFNFA
jgi:hypothetical protein